MDEQGQVVSEMFSHYLAVLKSKDQDLPSLKPVWKLSSFIKYIIRKPLGLWGRATLLTTVFKKIISAVNVQLCQYSVYLSAFSCIFVLKLKRFDKLVNETAL